MERTWVSQSQRWKLKPRSSSTYLCLSLPLSTLSTTKARNSRFQSQARRITPFLRIFHSSKGTTMRYALSSNLENQLNLIKTFKATMSQLRQVEKVSVAEISRKVPLASWPGTTSPCLDTLRLKSTPWCVIASTSPNGSQLLLVLALCKSSRRM
jgi:hypothetical protein